MRVLLFVGLILGTGCQGTIGPVKRRSGDDRILLPGSTPSEQTTQQRDKLPFGDSSPSAGPRTYFDNPFTKSGR
ncbi:MAG: hypothetical protein EBV06_07845 [Planctomycetia bacterium]|nr:hypothetical protein [Planctomycetia bacterium]